MNHPDVLAGAPSVSLETHAAEINRHDQRLFQAPSGEWWYRNERFSLTRFPNHSLISPVVEDLSSLFRGVHPLLLDWTRSVHPGEEGNAFLYVYDEPHYSIEELGYNARRDARRALRELDFRVMSLPEVLDQAFPVFENTRTRNGLSDGVPRAFRQRFEGLTPEAGYAFLGAFKEGELAAFVSVLSVDDWVSIGPYGHSDFRTSCPTDGLVSLVLDHFINTRKARLVSYGLSSVQEGSSRKGLHDFKTKVGFKAIPVRRCFQPHPLAALFIKGWGRGLLQSIIDMAPSNRILRKMGGVLHRLALD